MDGKTAAIHHQTQFGSITAASRYAIVNSAECSERPAEPLSAVVLRE